MRVQTPDVTKWCIDKDVVMSQYRSFVIHTRWISHSPSISQTAFQSTISPP